MADDVFAVLWDEAEARWRRHTEVLDWSPDYRIRGTDTDWLARDEYAHFAHWLEYALVGARSRLLGGPPPTPIADEDAQNDAWAAEDRALTEEEARRRCTSIRQDYVDLIRGLPEERRNERVAGVVRGVLVSHFDDHFGYMVAGMLSDEAAAWQRLTAALDPRPSEVLHTGDDGRPWRAADIYAHVERWMTVNIPRAETGLATGVVPELESSADDLNARWLAEDAGVTFEAARRRSFVAREAFMAQMRGIAIPQWTARLVSLYAGNAWGHYAEHLEYMEHAG
ncbi:MAG: hypothetical protein Q7K37_10090 [Dehalococcoidia bacterium]|nr:hypothetical protein [Dehalococcoidia bacterium]